MIGPVIVPVRVAGRVMPLIVISPSKRTRCALDRACSVEKTTSGCRSASKNSGDSRWACRFSSLTSRLAIRADAGEAAVLERGVEVGDGAAERADAHVLDLERDRRVDAIGAVGAGRKSRLLCDAHLAVTSDKLTTQAYSKRLRAQDYSRGACGRPLGAHEAAKGGGMDARGAIEASWCRC